MFDRSAIRHRRLGALLLAVGFCLAGAASPSAFSGKPWGEMVADEAALGSEAVKQKLDRWDAYEGTILATAAVLIAQSLLIGGFVVQLRRRRHSEARSQALLRAMPDFMFLQSAEGVYLDCHSRDPHQLLFPPEVFLGKSMREVLPQELLAIVEPAFKQASGASDPVLVEYDLDMPEGKRRYEARLVRSNHDQILTLVRDITEQKQAADALREGEAVLQASHRQIQDLAGRLIASQEIERARIARDLHDDLSQQLAGLSIALSSVKRGLTGVAPAGADLLGEVSSLQQRTVALAESVRRISHDLHPSVLAHAGLVATLKRYCDEIQQGQAVDVTFKAEGEFDSISPEAALCLYRVAQEGLRNVITHAEAHSAQVRLLRRGDLTELTIVDDGRGFDIAQAGKSRTGLGLVSINERVKLAAGTVSIVTELDKGTRMRVLLPAHAPVLCAS